MNSFDVLNVNITLHSQTSFTLHSVLSREMEYTERASFLESYGLYLA